MVSLFGACANSAISLDIAFFTILFLGTLIGVWRGFVKFVCKIAGTIFSIAIAIFFCVAFKNTLENWFGLESALRNALSATPTLGSWLSIAISFISLVILVRLLAWLVGSVGTALVEKFKPVRTVNKVLGGLLGLFSSALLLFFLLAVCYWIPVGSLHAFISDANVVGAIFNWEWFREAATLPF